MKVIPFFPTISSIQNFSVNLGELVCSFTLSWNNRFQCWFCDMATTEGENNSVRLVESTPLLGKTNALGLSGDFRILRANRLADDHITYDSLGSDWIFVYGTAAEWETFDGL